MAFLLIYFNLHITQICYRCLQRCLGVIFPLTANNKLLLSYITFLRKPLTWPEKYQGQLSHMALTALWEQTWGLLQHSESRRDPGSSQVATVLEAVIVKDLLGKDLWGLCIILIMVQVNFTACRGAWYHKGRRVHLKGVQWGHLSCT